MTAGRPIGRLEFMWHAAGEFSRGVEYDRVGRVACWWVQCWRLEMAWITGRALR